MLRMLLRMVLLHPQQGLVLLNNPMQGCLRPWPRAMLCPGAPMLGLSLLHLQQVQRSCGPPGPPWGWADHSPAWGCSGALDPAGVPSGQGPCMGRLLCASPCMGFGSTQPCMGLSMSAGPSWGCIKSHPCMGRLIGARLCVGSG